MHFNKHVEIKRTIQNWQGFFFSGTHRLFSFVPSSSFKRTKRQKYANTPPPHTTHLPPHPSSTLCVLFLVWSRCENLHDLQYGVSLCTDARPEICLSPRNIRTSTQEERLGSSPPPRPFEPKGKEERRGEGERRRGEECVSFLGRLPAARF